MQYSNFDLETVVTPVNVNVYESLLMEAGYDSKKRQFLVNSFREGFLLQYKGKENMQITAHNLKLRVGNEIVLWNKVMKEVKNKRYAGPFKKIPFKNYIQSPIGLVPKDNGRDTRLIFHLSHPRGKGTSVNANIPEDWCSVQYPDFMEAIKLCIKEGINCKMGKSDMKSAFRNLGMRVRDFKWLVMKAKSPIDGKWYFFVDKCLPFGSSISCAHFQAFSDSIAFLVEFRTKKPMINYLDDFLFTAALKALCYEQMERFLEICQLIDFLIALEKTVWSCSVLVFLGLLIDSKRQIVCLPAEKIEKALELIGQILAAKKITVHGLQRLCSFLNFVCRAIVPGRAFLRRFYSFTTCVGKKLMPHHHIRVNKDMRDDLAVWQ